jgi:hypothetical protein
MLQHIGNVHSRQDGKSFVDRARRLVMQRRSFQYVQGQAPQAQQIRSNLAVARSENLSLNFAHGDLLFACQRLSALVLIGKVTSEHSLAHIVQQTRRERFLGQCPLTGLQQNYLARAVSDRGAMLP